MGKWWRRTVVDAIRAYPELKAKLNSLQKQSIIAAYGPVSGRSGIGRPAERAAMKQLPSYEQTILEAVEWAIQETERLPDGKERLKIIDMVFWQRSHTIQGAGMQVNLSRRSACRRQEDFMVLVAKKIGAI